jgi:hypothetical protein
VFNKLEYYSLLGSCIIDDSEDCKIIEENLEENKKMTEYKMKKIADLSEEDKQKKDDSLDLEIISMSPLQNDNPMMDSFVVVQSNSRKVSDEMGFLCLEEDLETTEINHT